MFESLLTTQVIFLCRDNFDQVLIHSLGAQSLCISMVNISIFAACILVGVIGGRMSSYTTIRAPRKMEEEIDALLMSI